MPSWGILIYMLVAAAIAVFATRRCLSYRRKFRLMKMLHESAIKRARTAEDIIQKWDQSSILTHPQFQRFIDSNPGVSILHVVFDLRPDQQAALTNERSNDEDFTWKTFATPANARDRSGGGVAAGDVEGNEDSEWPDTLDDSGT